MQIDFVYKHHTSIDLVIDPNDTNVCDYKRIKTLCSDAKIEFKNHSFSHFITQLKSKHFDISVRAIPYRAIFCKKMENGVE